MKYDEKGNVLLTTADSIEILANTIRDMLRIRSDQELDKKLLLRLVRLSYDQICRDAAANRRLMPPWAVAKGPGKISNAAA